MPRVTVFRANPRVPEQFRQWVQTGGKVYCVHDDHGALAGYVRGHDRKYAATVAKRYGMRLGKQATRGQLASLVAFPEFGANRPRANPTRRREARGPAESRENGLFVHTGANRYYWDERLDGKTYVRVSAAEKEASKRNARGEHGGMIVVRPRYLIHDTRLAARALTEAEREWLARQEPGYVSAAQFKNPPRARRVVRVKSNPAASRVVKVLSTRAVELRYIHSEDKGQAYKHAFARGVTVQLLSDGSVRLFRPDGRPLWKQFED